MKNKWIAFLFFILKPFLPQQKQTNRSLIISTTGLGDTIWASGVLKAMKEKNGDLQIDLLTSPIGYQIFENSQELHRLFVLKNRNVFTFIPLFFRLVKNNYDSVLIFHASQRMAFILARLLNPVKLIATMGLNKGLDFLFTDLTTFSNIHEIERRYLIAEKLMGPLNRLPLHLSSIPAKDEITKKLNHLFSIKDTHYMVVQPSAKDRFKYWPVEYFRKVISSLYESYGLPILINGTPDEVAFTKQLETNYVHSIAGLFSLKEVMGIIKYAKLMITNDTGPMHIAFACQTPTVAMFCPTNPSICGPYLSNNYKIIYKHPTCFPCITKKCRAPFCMRQIKPEEVIDASKELL